MLLQSGSRDELEHCLIGGGQDYEARGAVAVGTEPVQGGDAPAVTGDEAREAELWDRAGKVVTDPSLIVEELCRNYGAYRVRTEVLGPVGATTIAVKTGERLEAAWLELTSEDVPLGHGTNVGMSATPCTCLRWPGVVILLPPCRGLPGGAGGLLDHAAHGK